MKYIAFGIISLVVTVFVIFGAPGRGVVQAQGSLPTPTNFKAVNGPNAGEAVLTWDAVAGANFYRVGWVAVTDVTRAFADGTDPLNHYSYADVAATTTYTIGLLTPGEEYLFTVASLEARFVESGSVELVRLTLNANGAACPVCPVCPDTGTPPTTQPLPPTPVGGDYDADNDGLIEIRSIAQLDAMRYDLDGDGVSEDNAYAAAFPGAAAGMGCPSGGCIGYELANDLDYGTTLSAQGWLPIGVYDDRADNNFDAVFDGNGHTIANLFIARGNTDGVGLFAVTNSTSTIRRVGLVNASVVGRTDVGGLVGWNNGEIDQSYASGAVSGTGGSVGGLVGSNHGSITVSYADASVNGSSRLVGGLVGDNLSTGTITASYAAGDASGADGYVGGLAGQNEGVITASYATGNASSGNWWVGGLTGYNKRGAITASYATGSVRGDWYVAGLAGYNTGTITASYAIGSVSGKVNVRGLVGGGGGTVTASYWNTETSGQPGSAGGIGWATAQLQSPTSATGIYANWNPSWWDFGTSEQYPVLKVAGLSVALQRGQATQPSTGAGQTTPTETDREALVAFYNATGGDNWTNNGGWLSDAPIGEWHGVTTDANGRVTELRLPSNGLAGTLPAELDNLAGLTWLDLDYNQLSGEIPAAVGSLSGLTVLRLGSNELTGAVPAELGNLANLTILGLGNNQLTGQIPSQLGNLSGLTRLSLWNNQLSGPIPAALGNLSGLTRLVLGGNQLTGPIPVSLGSLADLQHLNLSHNQLTGSIPAELGNLTRLESLNFDNNSLTGPIPAEVGNLTNLVALRMGNNQLDGELPSALGNLSSLFILGLGNNQLTGQIPDQIGNLSNVTLVSLYNNQLTGQIPSQLGNLSNLTRLSLGSNQLSGSIPHQLGNLTQLQHLYLQENQLTGSIPSQLGRLSDLSNLDLSSNRLSGEIPQTLGGLGSLKLLRLSKNQLTGTIPPALGNLSSLTRLYLYENRLTGELPIDLGQLAKIEVLNLSHNQLSGEIPEAFFASAATARSHSKNNQIIPAELVLPTNVVYFEPGLRLDDNMPLQPVFPSSLRVLNLSHNQFGGVIPTALSQRSNIQRAYVNNNNFSGNVQCRQGYKQMQSGKCVACTADMENGGIENDTEALAKLYELTDGRGKVNLPGFLGGGRPQWNNHDGWEDNFQSGGVGPPLDEWHGVVTNDAGRVIELNLGGNNLQGRTTVSDWAKHITDTNKPIDVWGCKYPLYWLEKLDFGDNGLDGDIGALLSDIRLQSGVTLEVDLGGAENNWTPASFYSASDGAREYYEDVDWVEVPDAYTLADEIDEVGGVGVDVDSTDIAKLGLRILSRAGSSSAARMIGKIGGGVGFIDTVLQHEAVAQVFIGVLQGKGNQELREVFLDGLGITSKPARDRFVHGCRIGLVWDDANGVCAPEYCRPDLTGCGHWYR